MEVRVQQVLLALVVAGFGCGKKVCDLLLSPWCRVAVAVLGLPCWSFDGLEVLSDVEEWQASANVCPVRFDGVLPDAAHEDGGELSGAVRAGFNQSLLYAS